MGDILNITAKVVGKTVDQEYVKLDNQEVVEAWWNRFDATVFNAESIAKAFTGGEKKGIIIGIGCGILATIGTMMVVDTIKRNKSDKED